MAEWINAIQHDIDFVPAWVFWSVDAVKASPLWDGRVVNLQVTDATETSIQLRALMSARTAATCGDLRCEIREKLISFLQSEMPIRCRAIVKPSRGPRASTRPVRPQQRRMAPSRSANTALKIRKSLVSPLVPQKDPVTRPRLFPAPRANPVVPIPRHCCRACQLETRRRSALPNPAIAGAPAELQI